MHHKIVIPIDKSIKVNTAETCHHHLYPGLQPVSTQYHHHQHHLGSKEHINIQDYQKHPILQTLGGLPHAQAA